MAGRIIGVYAADGTLWGEVSYWVGARIGRAHCSLCDITHGTFLPRSDWAACRDTLPLPFVTYHRNDQPPGVRTAAGGTTPVVVLEDAQGNHTLLLGPEEIEACGADPGALVAAIGRAMDRR